MGLLTLISALIATIKDTIKENVENARAEEEWQQYCDIDFDNIDYVVLEGTETAYRIEEEEEFDPVMTDFLTRQDGWQHYETKTVEYEVEDGENYCFTIKYKDGTKIHRVFHEDSSMTERLLKYVKKETEKKATVEDIVVSRYVEILHDSLDLLETTLNPETYFSRYRIALDNAKRILETTNSDYYKTYASKIVTDLTENKPQKYKEFIDRCNSEGKLHFYKDKLLSSNYGISLELKDYVRNLLEKNNCL